VKYLLAAVAVALISTAAHAEDLASKGAACSKIADSLQRLQCFDLAFPKDAEAVTGKEPSQATSSWSVTEDKSPLDDSVQISAGLTPSHVSYTGIGEGQAYLIVRCQDHTTSLYVATNMFMVSDTISVTTRISDEKAVQSKWDRSTNYKAVGLWDGGQSIPFIKRFTDNGTLAIRVQDKDKLDAQFDLADVSSVIAKVSTACGWKPN
jgi:type VI secretion system VasI family protein